MLWDLSWLSWLGHYATGRDVADSNSDVSGFFYWPNPCSSTVALGSNISLTEVSIRTLHGDKGRKLCRICGILDVSQLYGPSRPSRHDVSLSTWFRSDELLTHDVHSWSWVVPVSVHLLSATETREDKANYTSWDNTCDFHSVDIQWNVVSDVTRGI
jgi:hypothetical protein